MECLSNRWFSKLNVAFAARKQLDNNKIECLNTNKINNLLQACFSESFRGIILHFYFWPRLLFSVWLVEYNSTFTNVRSTILNHPLSILRTVIMVHLTRYFRTGNIPWTAERWKNKNTIKEYNITTDRSERPNRIL